MKYKKGNNDDIGKAATKMCIVRNIANLWKTKQMLHKLNSSLKTCIVEYLYELYNLNLIYK